MSVLVTGAAGFIGSHLVEALARRGHEVVGVDRRAIHQSTATSRLRRPVQFIEADLATAPRGGAVDDALECAEAIFHLAGCPGVREEGEGIEEIRHRDNVMAGERVLRMAHPDIPVVVASSSSVYGSANLNQRGGSLRASAEQDPLRPLGGYGRSKVDLERRCLRRAARGGLVAVARPFTVAGERQRADMAVARWVRCVREGRPIRIFGSPHRTRDVTDVRDVAEALVRMAERGAIGPVNVGTGAGRRLVDIAVAVCGVLGEVVEIVVEPASPQDPPATLADTTLCRRLLGFVPVTDLVDLIRRQAGAGGSAAIARAV